MWAFTTHTGDILGRGGQDVCFFWTTFWGIKIAGVALWAHVGMESVQDSAFSATLTQGEFAKNLQPLPTAPKL